MAGLVYLVIFLQSIILAESSHTPITPASFNFSTLGVLAANGSSAVGGCSSVTLNLDATSTCNNPASSVLFDRRTPTLAALDGDSWASQFMILHTPEFGYSPFYIDPGFGTSTNRKRVEVTIFNCPQWGTGVRLIQVQHFNSYYQQIAITYITVISCTSLLRVCIPFQTTTSTRFRLYFQRYSGVKQVHIAEITFYSSSTPCPAFTTLPGTWTPPPPAIQTTATTAVQPQDTTQSQDTTQMQHSVQTEETSAKSPDMTTTKATMQTEDPLLAANGAQGSLQVEFKDSSLVLVIAVFATIMILQTTVIFIIMVIIARRRKSTDAVTTRSGPNITKHETFEMEDQVYETVDAGNNNIHGCSGRGRGKVQFMKNESYAIPKEV